MANFVPVEPEAATGRAAELLAQVHKSLGLTPNMTKVMASSPTLLQAYLALSGAVAGGVLSPAVRERLAIATAELGWMRYCLSRAHSTSQRQHRKLDSDSLRFKAREGGDSKDAHVAALLKLSTPSPPTPAALTNRSQGCAAEPALPKEGSTVVALALNGLTNYFNVLAHVDNDWRTSSPLNHHQN
ncbi:carboxymuconolactone decarboxylase family protein [Mycobacterium kiyosense]|nr:hypothetical protein IWGMT90018_40920 [Mycobacterium kiyosense]